MDAVNLIALLTYAAGAYAYAALLALALRQPAPSVAVLEDSRRVELDRVAFALWVVTFVWFLVNAAAILQRIGVLPEHWVVDSLGLWLAFAFPPLIVHVTYAEVASSEPTSRVKRPPLGLIYGVTQALAVGGLLVFSGVLPMSRELTGRVMTISIFVAFIGAAIYAIQMVAGGGRRASRTPRQRQSRAWHIGLFAVMAVLFVFLLSLTTRERPATIALGLLEVAAKALPLPFVFVGTYFESRFEFVDLVVKRGLSLIVTLVVLGATFAAILPLVGPMAGHWMGPWLFTVALLPAVALLPWLHGRIGARLDRTWLGRRFTPVEAVRHFLMSLRSATSEEQLVADAERGLTEIFGAPARIQLGARGPAGFDVAEEVPIRLGDAAPGAILMGPRESEAPYFGEDVALLGSLADVLAAVVETLRLQQRKQELTLHASRSELKALRAQINPHFLFNALNAIAGLIHKDPAAADRTVEQLADVFRYTLRGADQEWAVLDDELDFVRAYLNVEQTRFGDRLRVEVRVADDVRRARVPTMVLQTLVENAVKHGVAEVRDRATVVIEAAREGDRLVLSVTDNGPGPSARSRRPPSASKPHGLANIRERLQGYFGAEATLVFDRDEARGLTHVSVTLPLQIGDGRLPLAAGDR